MRLIQEYSRDDNGKIVLPPIETNFTPDLKFNENPAEAKRYRLVAVVGHDFDTPLLCNINMILDHNEASLIYQGLHGEYVEEDAGNWARRSMDIAMELGRACTFDEGLKQNIIHIIQQLVESYWDERMEFCTEQGNEWDTWARSCSQQLDVQMLEIGLDEAKNKLDGLPLQNMIAFMLLISHAITYFPRRLEVVTEPLDEYDYVLEYEDNGREVQDEDFVRLASIVYPETVDGTGRKTITITDAAGNIFEHMPVHPLVSRQVANGEHLFNVTQIEVIEFLAYNCVEHEEYGRAVEAYAFESLVESTQDMGRYGEELVEKWEPIDRNNLDDDELFETYFRLLDKECTWWSVTDEENGQTENVSDVCEIEPSDIDSFINSIINSNKGKTPNTQWKND